SFSTSPVVGCASSIRSSGLGGCSLSRDGRRGLIRAAAWGRGRCGRCGRCGRFSEIDGIRNLLMAVMVQSDQREPFFQNGIIVGRVNGERARKLICDPIERAATILSPITLEPLIIDGQSHPSVCDAVVALGLCPVPDRRHTLFLGTVRPRTFNVGAAGDRVGSAYACKHWG